MGSPARHRRERPNRGGSATYANHSRPSQRSVSSRNRKPLDSARVLDTFTRSDAADKEATKAVTAESESSVHVHEFVRSGLELFAAIIALGTLLLTTVPNASITDLSAGISQQEAQLMEGTRLSERIAKASEQTTHDIANLEHSLRQGRLDVTEAQVRESHLMETVKEIASGTSNFDKQNEQLAQTIALTSYYIDSTSQKIVNLSSVQKSVFAQLFLDDAVQKMKRVFWDEKYYELDRQIPSDFLYRFIARELDENHFRSIAILGPSSTSKLYAGIQRAKPALYKNAEEIEKWRQNEFRNSAQLVEEFKREGMATPARRVTERMLSLQLGLTKSLTVVIRYGFEGALSPDEAKSAFGSPQAEESSP